MRVLWVEMDTQLNCQSRQTNTKLILVWSRAIAGSRGCPGLLERNIPPWDGNVSETPSTGHRSQGGSGLLGPSPLATGDSRNLPFSGISAQVLSFPCERGVLRGPAGWGALAQPWRAQSRGCHPLPSFPCVVPVPGQESLNRHRITLSPPKKNHQIKSVPLKRTEKCRFPRFGRSSYTFNTSSLP